MSSSFLRETLPKTAKESRNGKSMISIISYIYVATWQRSTIQRQACGHIIWRYETAAEDANYCDVYTTSTYNQLDY